MSYSCVADKVRQRSFAVCWEQPPPRAVIAVCLAVSLYHRCHGYVMFHLRYGYGFALSLAAVRQSCIEGRWGRLACCLGCSCCSSSTRPCPTSSARPWQCCHCFAWTVRGTVTCDAGVRSSAVVGYGREKHWHYPFELSAVDNARKVWNSDGFSAIWNVLQRSELSLPYVAVLSLPVSLAP